MFVSRDSKLSLITPHELSSLRVCREHSIEETDSTREFQSVSIHFPCYLIAQRAQISHNRRVGCYFGSQLGEILEDVKYSDDHPHHMAIKAPYPPYFPHELSVWGNVGAQPSPDMLRCARNPTVLPGLLGAHFTEKTTQSEFLHHLLPTDSNGNILCFWH